MNTVKTVQNQSNQSNQSKLYAVRRALNAFLAVWTAIVGALFILQVWRIFLAGDGFTVENVSARFFEISIPFALWLLAALFSGVLDLAFPVYEKPVAYIDPSVTLRKLQARIPTNDEGRYAFNVRFIAWVIGFVISLICAVVACVYLTGSGYKPVADSGFFAEHPEAERLVFALLWVFAAFGVLIAVSLFNARALRKEIALAKTRLSEYAKKGVVVQKSTALSTALKKKNVNDKITLVLRLAIGGLSVLLLILGIFNGGMADVLGKAINICTQCIGLG